MLNLGCRQLLAVLLSVLVLNQPIVMAASTGSAPRSVLGSITSTGSVRVGEMPVPTEGTLFSGDRVQTNNGNAVIQYRDGARIMLASESLANFAPARMQLEKGLMTIQTVAGNGMVFAVSTLRLEPATAKASANVTLKDSKASVAVTEGTLKVVDPSGVQLASLHAGDARLFEEAAAATPAAPQGSNSQGSNGGGDVKATNGTTVTPPGPTPNHSHRTGTWVIAALGAAGVGLGVGIAGLVSANDASDSASRANASAATANTNAQAAITAAAAANTAAASATAGLAAANASITALKAQVTALSAQVAANASASAQLKAISADLATQLGLLTVAEANLASAQQTLTTLVRTIASQPGGQATAAQLAQLQSLLTTIITLNAQLQVISLQIIADQNAFNTIIIVISPTRAA